jgi:hypothetical protein
MEKGKSLPSQEWMKLQLSSPYPRKYIEHRLHIRESDSNVDRKNIDLKNTLLLVTIKWVLN